MISTDTTQHAWSRPSEALSRLQTLVSEYTGVVRNAYELLLAPDDARMFYYGCEVCETRGLLGHSMSPRVGGAHYQRDAALAAALGEATERYCGTCLPELQFVQGSATVLGFTAVDPESFALFREDQYAQQGFPYQPFTRATPVRWVQGFSLLDTRPVLLPVQLVYLPTSLARGEVPIGYATSSGMACGLTLQEAVLKGLLELAERDAFMVVWANRLTLPRVDIRSDPRLEVEDLRHFAPSGLQYDVMDLSRLANVPTAVAVIWGRPSDAVALALGAASASTFSEACSKALREAFQTRQWIRQMHQRQARSTPVEDVTKVATFEEHVLLYAHHEHAQRVRFLTDSDTLTSIDQVSSLEGETVAEWICAIVKLLQARGGTAYAVDVTSPDVRQAGLCVVKVVSPELCPLDVGYTTRFLGGRRLYEAAYDAGLRARPLRPEEVHPYPHPFP